MKLTYHDNPDDRVKQICRELIAFKKKEGEGAYWRVVKEHLRRDPWFMFRVALEWSWLDENLVGHKLIKHMADNWGEDTAVLLPRGHGKTLPLSGLCISTILNNPKVAILEISRTQDNADKIGETVAQHLMYNDYLQRCFGRKYNDDGFLPSSTTECSLWGKDGYRLPYVAPRMDPTLLCIPLRAAKAGKHPDIIWIDDPIEEENNHELGWAQVEKAYDGCKFLLPPDGVFWSTFTRWHDADPAGKIVDGKLYGKQGKFKVIQFSCYEDDNTAKEPTYPRKTRWNMDKPSGYTKEMLDQMRKPKSEGGLGEFFDAQMRNDPKPAERMDIKISDINIYTPDKLPKLGTVRSMGVETTGGGLPIYQGLLEHCEELKIFLPLEEIANPRKVGIQKKDRIIAAIQPLTHGGKLHVQRWMLGDENSRDSLGYEIRRLGVATHDDIVDALHNVPAHLSRNITPLGPQEPAHVYISVDLAWTEERRADFTVAMAVAVDHSGNHYILDYDRFQISSPTGIYDRLIKFYRKFEEPQTIRKLSGQKFPGRWH